MGGTRCRDLIFIHEPMALKYSFMVQDFYSCIFVSLSMVSSYTYHCAMAESPTMLINILIYFFMLKLYFILLIDLTIFDMLSPFLM